VKDANTPEGMGELLPNHQLFGSDLIAEALREQGFPYICLNPGASFRGLHDSLVNHLGNRTPEIVTCMYCARLRQGNRPGAGRCGAFECRADACLDGYVQRLVRPHPDAGDRRHRSP
jgi:hypothetical protein